MATPLYDYMKNRGTSLYVFPSASHDIGKDFQNPQYKINFSKFVLLNFPKQELARQDNEGQEDGTMNFSKTTNGPRFYNFQPGATQDMPGPVPDKFSEQLIESLRNYIANSDETYRISRKNDKEDFYNLSERKTPSEILFWKWARKLNLIDLEPAQHKIDWDKFDDDFENQNKPNESSLDFFRKYLWKEREINTYQVNEVKGIKADTAQIRVKDIMKIKNGDHFIFEGEILNDNAIVTGKSYEVFDVQIFDEAEETIFKVNESGLDLQIYQIDGLTCHLDYNRFVEYVGEITSQSKIETSKKNYTEITANIPHHAGRTPTVLFDIEDNSNYYPNLELPILPEQIQDEILGSENIKSPIRQNPDNYPGSYYGYFDTNDKTYLTSNGDKLRKSGNYYGILRTNNIDLDKENYKERLTQFNSDKIDGLNIDFDTEHYYQMDRVGLNNFDEFNSYNFNNKPPQDFEFNAILWYYEVDDGSGNIYTNLYGIEFLNNPNDDFDETDPDGQRIRPFQKLVSNGDQDGLSYIYNLNVSFKSDNDVVPMSYEPNTIYNDFNFDLYQNILQTNAQLQDNFLNIISGFTDIQEEMNQVKSLVFSQTDLDKINQRIDNLDELLQLYSSMQIQDTSSIKIEENYTGNYPILKLHVENSEYAEIRNLLTNDILQTTNNKSKITVPKANNLMLNIRNNTKEELEEPLRIELNEDLNYTQSIDIFLKAEESDITNEIAIDINYLKADGEKDVSNLLITDMPTNLLNYNANDPNSSEKSINEYINSEVFQYSKNIDVQTIDGKTLIKVTEPYFSVNEVLYIDNLYLKNLNTDQISDYSGAYKIESIEEIGEEKFYKIDLDGSDKNLVSIVKISNYKGMKLTIMRVLENTNNSIGERYKITKELL